MPCIDAAYCYRCRQQHGLVCMFGKTMICAKMTERIEVSYGLWTFVGPYVLGSVQI